LCQTRLSNLSSSKSCESEAHRQECLCYSSRKRAAAAAIPRRVGILENKSLADQRLFVLQRRAIQIQKALWINENARAKFLENFVTVPWLCVEAHRIGQTGAATPLHAHAQAPYFWRHAFLFEELANLLRRALGEVDGDGGGGGPPL